MRGLVRIVVVGLAALLWAESHARWAAAEAEAGPASVVDRVGISALGRIEPRNGVRHVAGPPRPTVVIEKVLVEQGDRVSQGQELAVLAGIALQEADVERYRAELAQAEREVRRREGLAKASAGAQSELEAAHLRRDVAHAELARAEAELELSRIRAPMAGQVIEIHKREGERLDEGGLLELADTSVMYAIAEVYETDIGGIRVGQRASVRSPALPRPLTGSVEKIGLKVNKKDVLQTDPVADADARVVEVEIRLDQSELAAALTNLRVDVVLER
jgi:HlyD family secretion protein